jgi:hypothetical protein
VREEVQPRQHLKARGHLQEGVPREEEEIQYAGAAAGRKLAEEADEEGRDDREKAGGEEGE